MIFIVGLFCFSLSINGGSILLIKVVLMMEPVNSLNQILLMKILLDPIQRRINKIFMIIVLSFLSFRLNT